MRCCGGVGATDIVFFPGLKPSHARHTAEMRATKAIMSLNNSSTMNPTTASLVCDAMRNARVCKNARVENVTGVAGDDMRVRMDDG